jgi:hypothetical protein
VSRALFQIRRGAAVWLTLAIAACSADSPLTAPEYSLETSVAELQSADPVRLYCPHIESLSAAKRIGPKGGTLNLAGTKLVVPRGAVPVETEFVLTIPAGDWLELDIDAGGAEHYSFARPVTITVNYSRCGTRAAETEALSAWYVDETSGDFVQDMGAIDLKAGKKLTFETDHLSKYAIAW